jgi:hypothetical protein
LFDIGAQANIWRIIAVSERRAQDIANAVLPGLGYIFAIILLLGGLPFNFPPKEVSYFKREGAPAPVKVGDEFRLALANEYDRIWLERTPSERREA